MSLDYQLGDIANWREVCLDEEGELSAVTHVLVFGTLSVGLGKITERNLTEWIARWRIVESIDGYSLITPDGPRMLTDEEIAAHVGLATNVQDQTRLGWLKQQIGQRVDGVKYDAERDTKRKEGAEHGV